MEIIESTEILKNLNTVLENSKKRFKQEFVMQEVTLNDTFKMAFRNYLSTKDCVVEYFEKTTVVTNSAKQLIYIANQWFVIASYFVDFYTEMLTYRDLFIKICDLMGMNTEKKKEYATKLKSLPSEVDKTDFLSVALQMLKTDFPGRDEEYNVVAEYLWTFASNYKWWAGSKTINRHDFYISALLKQLNVVNNSSEYLAIIVNAYASTLKLRILVENVENFTEDLQVNKYTLSDSMEEDITKGIVSEPKVVKVAPIKSTGISISAASLERFQLEG